MVGCFDKTGKHKVRFSKIPTVIRHQGQFMEELTTEQRRWIAAISRADLTEKLLKNNRVCKEHFVYGKKAADWDSHNVNWVPTKKLGHSEIVETNHLKDPKEQLNIANEES